MFATKTYLLTAFLQPVFEWHKVQSVFREYHCLSKLFIYFRQNCRKGRSVAAAELAARRKAEGIGKSLRRIRKSSEALLGISPDAIKLFVLLQLN